MVDVQLEWVAARFITGIRKGPRAGIRTWNAQNLTPLNVGALPTRL